MVNEGMFFINSKINYLQRKKKKKKDEFGPNAQHWFSQAARFRPFGLTKNGRITGSRLVQ